MPHFYSEPKDDDRIEVTLRDTDDGDVWLQLDGIDVARVSFHGVLLLYPFDHGEGQCDEDDYKTLVAKGVQFDKTDKNQSIIKTEY